MTAHPTAQLRSELEPVRQALLADAAAAVEILILDATAAAHQRVTVAEAEADQAISDARRRTSLAVAAAADRELARHHGDAHGRILAAKRDLQNRLIHQTRIAATGLRNHPDYPALLDRLEDQARRQLGPNAHIDRDTEPDGGIIATVGTKRVDYRLTALADSALAALADQASEIWS